MSGGSPIGAALYNGTSAVTSPAPAPQAAAPAPQAAAPQPTPMPTMASPYTSQMPSYSTPMFNGQPITASTFLQPDASQSAQPMNMGLGAMQAPQQNQQATSSMQYNASPDYQRMASGFQPPWASMPGRNLPPWVQQFQAANAPPMNGMGDAPPAWHQQQYNMANLAKDNNPADLLNARTSLQSNWQNFVQQRQDMANKLANQNNLATPINVLNNG